MIFKKFSRKAKAELALAHATPVVDRTEVKQRMLAVEETSRQLTEAVRQTQEISVNLADKISREFKLIKKSLTSISAKLTVAYRMKRAPCRRALSGTTMQSPRIT